MTVQHGFSGIGDFKAGPPAPVAVYPVNESERDRAIQETHVRICAAWENRAEIAASIADKCLTEYAVHLGCVGQAAEYAESSGRISQFDAKTPIEKWLNELRVYERTCLALFEAMSARIAATRQGALQ